MRYGPNRVLMGDSTIGTTTVMFTDLVGSTELRSRVGEDAAEILRRRHDAVLAEAIRSNGGRVVKHLGDGVMATFASAAHAVGAAVALQQSIDRANRRPDAEQLRVRVGISAGDVAFEGDDCFGLAVVEAQRLEASADPGTIRCAELVMHLGRGRGGHEFRLLGDLDLKGLPDPLAACEVLWEPLAEQVTAETEIELPPVLAGVGLPFSGRDDVLQSLVEGWKECAGGRFGVVLLAGEPGAGKTRLAQELARWVQIDGAGHGAAEWPATGALVLAGRCDEDVNMPFQAFSTALEWFVRHAPSSTVSAALGDFPGDLSRLVPHLGTLVADLPPPLHDKPDAERFRLFQAVESWLSVGGADRPRLFVIDDLHCADRATLLLLRQLITNHPAGLMVLGTYRDTDVDRAHPLAAMLADFRRMDRVTRVSVGGLGEDGVRELFVRAGGHDLDEAGLQFAQLVQRETSGNPFFVVEVLRHLAETGALVESDVRWTSDLSPEEVGIPEGIRDVVGQRLSRLGADVERVLRLAAVIGYEFRLDLLSDVAGADADVVLDALDAAVAANLVIEIGVDRHRFAHGLVRETLHDELSSSRRARQHRKVAEALEARHAGDIDEVITELATHWAEASAGGDSTRAIEVAERAGDLAMRRGAYENGVGWFERVRELMDDGDLTVPERRRVLVKLAAAQTYSGAVAEGRVNALTGARAAISAGDADTAVDALGISARASLSEADAEDPERVAVIRDALALAGLTDLQRAVLLGELAKELIFERDIPGRRRALEEQQALLPHLPVLERARLITRPGASSLSGMNRDDLRAGIGFVAEAIELETAPSVRRQMAGSLWFWAAMAGDRATMDDALAAALEGRPVGAYLPNLPSMLYESMSLTMAGDLEAAESTGAEVVRMMEVLGLPEAGVYRIAFMLANTRERGTLCERGSVADAIGGLGHPTGPARSIAAFIRFLAGDLDPVLEQLEAIEGEEFADGGGYPTSMACWCEIVPTLGSPEQQRLFVDRLIDKTGLNLMTGGAYFGPVDRFLAMLYDALGEHQRADELFSAAVEQQEAIKSPPWVARTQLDWAESLIARGDDVRAQSSLDAAAHAIGDLDLTESRSRLAALTQHLVGSHPH